MTNHPKFTESHDSAATCANCLEPIFSYSGGPWFHKNGFAGCSKVYGEAEPSEFPAEHDPNAASTGVE